jgi:hypothetical protein
VMPQIRGIQENTHSQVGSVCSDSSLNPQQKRQKIHQLHQEAQQQIEALVNAQQLEALRNCREQRGAVVGAHLGNPCSSTPTYAAPTTTPAKP